MSKQVKGEKLKAKNDKQDEMKQSVCLLGDEQLVKEFASEFEKAGIAAVELKNLSSLKAFAKKSTIAFELSLAGSEQKVKNLQALDALLPAGIPIVTNAITATVLSQSQSVQHKERLAGIAAFPTLTENMLAEIAPSLYTSQEIADTVVKFFSESKKECSIVEDSIGMVMPRILCQSINEALFTVQNDVANPKDVDSAMKLAANYPYGPIEWGERIGFKNVVAVLDALYQNHGEERYRVAPLLRQMAAAGKFWS